MTDHDNKENGIIRSSDQEQLAKTWDALFDELFAGLGEPRLVVLATTNRAEDLDPALVRPRRFSRVIGENAFLPPDGGMMVFGGGVVPDVKIDGEQERPSRLLSMIDPANAYDAPVVDGQPREPLEPLHFGNAFWEPNGTDMVIGHELPHGLPGDFVARSPELEEVFRDSVRFAAGQRFRVDRPDLVAVIEKHAGRTMTNDELGTAIKLGREKPADYEVMALEAQECYARLEVMFAEELAAAKS